MMKFLKKLIVLIIGLTIFMGIPIYFDKTALIMLSWLPALIAMAYLDDE